MKFSLFCPSDTSRLRVDSKKMDTMIFAAQSCIRNMLGGLASDVVQQVKMPTDKPEDLSLILRTTEWKVL